MHPTFLDYARCQRPDGSFYGSRGKCKQGSPVEAAKEGPVKKNKKLKGQALANAMMQYANIENRVRANYKGSLASKKAKLELEKELEREGVPSKAKLKEMALAQRNKENAPALKNSKRLETLKKRLEDLKKKTGKPGTKEQLKKIEKELREMMKG